MEGTDESTNHEFSKERRGQMRISLRRAATAIVVAPSYSGIGLTRLGFVTPRR